MALPNAFRPTVPEPDRHRSESALPVPNKTVERTTDRPSSSSNSGKDKFKAILQKKADSELTDNVESTDDVGEDTTTSPFDLAAEASVQKGKGLNEPDPFADAGTSGKSIPMPTTTSKTGFDKLSEETAATLEEEGAVEDASTLSQSAVTATSGKKNLSQQESSLNPLLPSAGSIASEDDIKNLQLFTREDTLKAFASWETKSKSSSDLTTSQTADAAQMQAQITGVAQVNAVTSKSDMSELVQAREARITRIQLVDELVKALSQLRTTDRTETTLTLKHPPLFEGVSITITEFKTAQKEFNITFFNLTDPTARLLIEAKQNQESLRNALVEKGYTLQMITIEPKLNIATYTPDSKRQGQEEKESGQGNDQGGFKQRTG